MKAQKNIEFPIMIGFIGSHCIGKTIQGKKSSKHFSERGFKVRKLGEAVRKYDKSKINKIGTLPVQKKILEDQIEGEQKLIEERGIHIILLDRCMLDNFAYWLRIALLNNVSKDIIQKKMLAVFEHSKQYDILLFIEPFYTKKIEPDGFRSTDLAWRMEMHDAVYNIISQFSRTFLIQRIKALLRNRGFLIQGIKALLRDRKFLVQRIKVLLRKDRYNVPVIFLTGSIEEVFEQAKEVIETHLLLGQNN